MPKFLSIRFSNNNYFLLVLSLFLFSSGAFAQEINYDWLIKNKKNDTAYVHQLLTYVENNNNEEENKKLNLLALETCKALRKNSNKNISSKAQLYLGEINNNLGYAHKISGEVLKGLDYYQKAEKIFKQLKEETRLANLYVNMGYLYRDIGDFKKSIDCFGNTRKIFERLKDKPGLARAMLGLGQLYSSQGDTKNALIFFTKSMEIQKSLNNDQGVAVALNNIGLLQSSMGQLEEAIKSLKESLTIVEKSNDMNAKPYLYNSLGHVYLKKDMLNEASDYYQKAFEIAEKGSDMRVLAFSLSYLASTEEKRGNIQKAIQIGNKALEYAKKTGFPANIRSASNFLYTIFKKTGDSKKALEMHELTVNMDDSLTNMENKKASVQQQIKYEYESKRNLDSIKNIENKKVLLAQIQVRDANLKRKENMQILFVVIIVLVAVFSILLYSRYRKTKNQALIISEQKKTVEEQKIIVETKHKEITDSINYAERILRSFLATNELLNKHLQDYFIFFKPKNVVGGDFYWASPLRNGSFTLVTGDSTGHGVPGAFMSLLNVTSLEKATETYSNPSEILNETRKIIIDRLQKDGSAEGGKDGMDCSVLAFDFNQSCITYAGANNPVWIIRQQQIQELLPNKMPVGKSDKDKESFTEQRIPLSKGDIVYTLTDGFADQFGGVRGKKFMYKQLKELLLSISVLPMREQKERLSQALSEWKGDLEQVDDVTLIGIRI